MKVLIIDDSVVMRMIVERALRAAGVKISEVLSAANGIEGLAVLEEATRSGALPGLILCDLHMPAMGGLDFLLEKQRRNLAPTVPVVMITAEGAHSHVLQAIAAGAHAYISKPFTIEQMQASVLSLPLFAA